ncbi:hypothetical protein MFLO_04415 [Listeria floridensis FSL S10-1187]|uniref:Uncharacterized protein n=1 Tax=Listeria floridensis FSL S10-1187 TaxID=1265817 RepID=A0ABP3AZZ6_9LIST|nr:hypothetical protein [Listeria floridensis]EUJ33152.1 hypothetical protein MFLO_04415 [Listeria floridensis FSL S10-1187]
MYNLFDDPSYIDRQEYIFMLLIAIDRKRTVEIHVRQNERLLKYKKLAPVYLNVTTGIVQLQHFNEYIETFSIDEIVFLK